MRGGSRGNMHVKIFVEVPLKLSKEQKAELEKFDATLEDSKNHPLKAGFESKAKPFLSDK